MHAPRFGAGMPKKDPKGGLTAEGRRYFAKKEGARLLPGVKGAADTPEKQRRKGSFLRRHFATLRGPLLDDAGKPTRLALSAHAWGEPVPKTKAAARRLAEKGTRLLERYARSKRSSVSKSGAPKRAASKRPGAKRRNAKRVTAKRAKNSLVANINRRKRKGTSRSKRESTISREAYAKMQKGWPKSARKRANER